MARNLFGGTAADVAEDVSGARAPGAVGAVWSGVGENATQITDLTDEQKGSIASLKADANGMIPPFYGPDGAERLWVDFGAGRVALVATNAGERLAAHLTALDPHGDQAAITQTIGVADGIAGLGPDGTVPLSQLPDVATLGDNGRVRAEQLPRNFLGAVPTARFNLDGPFTQMFSKRKTGSYGAHQEVAIDEVNQLIYVGQVIQGGMQFPDETAPVDYDTRSTRGDICISQMNMAGDLLGSMYIRGAGHGVSIAIEQGADGGTWLWTDADSSSSGFARGLHRLKFQAAAVLDSKNLRVYRPFGVGSHGMSCAIDPVYRRMSVHYTYPDPDVGNGARRYVLFDLDEAAQDVWVPLAVIDQPVNQPAPGVGTFQGHTTWGDYAYSLDGDPLGPIYLTALCWNTGRQISRQLITFASELTTYREPEGLCIWVPDPSAPHKARLVMGITDGPSEDRDYTLGYLEASSFSPTSLGINQPTVKAGVDVVATSGSPALNARGSGGANIAQFFRADDANPSTWISTGGHIATNANGYFTGDAVQLGSLNVDTGGAKGTALGISNVLTPPTGSPSNGVAVYSEGGKLKVRQTDGGTVSVSPLPGTWLPTDYGLKSWSYDLSADSRTPGDRPSEAGRLYLVGVPVREVTMATKVACHVMGFDKPNSTVTAAYMGIYDKDLKRIAVTSNVSTSIPEVHNVGGQMASFNLTAPVTLAPGSYYVAILVRGTGTTVPYLAATNWGATATTSGAKAADVNGVHRWLQTTSTSLTTLPTTLTLAGMNDGMTCYWAGLG
ncbi:hypothetical protein ACGFZC_16145 [[Kitasatospora] papulosa]|uniref:phage baseplate protein n=1 Tax=[Kitasatospora] papulosa TaxID=1464011 RepID=UPI0037127906